MNPIKQFKELKKKELEELFVRVDAELNKLGKAFEITVIGGAAVVILDIIPRATRDIDLANSRDAIEFRDLFENLEVKIQVVSIYTTVEFVDPSDSTIVFEGTNLKVRAAIPDNLIKMKLERFIDRDEDDVLAIIEYEKINYSHFKNLVSEGLDYLVAGQPINYVLSALNIVERAFPEELDDFRNTFKQHIPR